VDRCGKLRFGLAGNDTSLPQNTEPMDHQGMVSCFCSTMVIAMVCSFLDQRSYTRGSRQNLAMICLKPISSPERPLDRLYYRKSCESDLPPHIADHGASAAT